MKKPFFIRVNQGIIRHFKNDSVSLGQHLNGLDEKKSLLKVVDELVGGILPEQRTSAEQLFIIKIKANSTSKIVIEEEADSQLEKKVFRKLQGSLFCSVSVQLQSWNGEPAYVVLLNDATESTL